MAFSFQNPGLIAFSVVFLAVVIIIGMFLLNPVRPEKTVSSAIVRIPEAAGTFYPADPAKLKSQIDNDLNQSPKINLPAPPRIIIVPHAGLDYAGITAAAAFKQLAGSGYRKIILLGPSHFHSFTYAAIDNSAVWQTPLGKVKLDADLAAKILSPAQNIIPDPVVDKDEHSLEMELIFLQSVLPDFKIVPILLSNPDDALISALAYRIAQNFDNQTLLVISSDLSHYPDYNTANKVDKNTISAVISGNMDYFKTLPDGIATLACGFEAIRVGNQVSGLLGLNPAQLIKYQNSGDMTGDKSRVVGYGSLIYAGSDISLKIPQLSPAAQQEALDLARGTLTEFVTGATPSGVINIANPELNAPLGAFVTLYKKGDLRGCIGEFEPDRPLYKVIQDKTVDAAGTDPRFKPVTADELADISVEISVMTPKVKISDWHKINLGTDGVVIIQGNQSGTFLPQVATDTGWKLEEFLSHLCSEKAGLPSNCYLNPATEIYTFQAQVFK
jgi:AmmeMemoRadiSam system protein B/AmmeMemoRadiSam system protein A